MTKQGLGQLTVTVTVRCTPEQKDAMTAAAEAVDMTRSEWILMACEQQLARIPGVDQPKPLLKAPPPAAQRAQERKPPANHPWRGKTTRRYANPDLCTHPYDQRSATREDGTSRCLKCNSTIRRIP